MAIAYRPLDQTQKEIRLLEIKSASRLDKPLRGTLFHARLPEASYTALSYVWGQPIHDKSAIAIKYAKPGARLFSTSGSETYDHEIGSSLSRSLRHLRQKYGKFVIWTDALCINQTDNEEKSWHIPLMSDIYSKAKEVHAWLGPRYDDNDNLIRNVHTAFELTNTVWSLADKVNKSHSLLPEQDWLEACFKLASADEQSDNPQDSDGQWLGFSNRLRSVALSSRQVVDNLASVMDLAANDYFARMWILQETGRANRLTFHYGLRQAPHRRVLLTLAVARSLGKSSQDLPVIETLQSLDARFLNCLLARTTCGQSLSFQHVMRGAYFTAPPLPRATNMRDLIYARLGLAKDPIGITVNYDLSVAEVFADASRFLLLEGSLELLITFKPYARHRGEVYTEDKMPSWANDWSIAGMDSFVRYRAAKDTTQQLVFTNYRDATVKQALNMSGVSVGNVQITKERFSWTVLESGLHRSTVTLGDLQAVDNVLSEENRMALVQRMEYIYEELGLEVPHAHIGTFFTQHSSHFAPFWCWWLYWVASLLELIGEAELLYPEKKSTYNIAELIFRHVPQELRGNIRVGRFGSKEGLLALIDYERWSSLVTSQGRNDNHPQDEAIMQLAEWLFHSAWGMRPAMLAGGRLAYIPEDASPEDEMVIFYGVKAPLVIRRCTEDTYRIIGPAHVCGAMEGQLMDIMTTRNTYNLI
ncbi:unnamed protein product [Periconia digitata]|uniref:Heterokaryon incompatibility domain-containing protein n=1 Tax=Periconia digitata TaxID=1303443 RepID=A0A9W4XLP9_9PLEO|nr:unnamed protein product [Periconia digitata]